MEFNKNTKLIIVTNVLNNEDNKLLIDDEYQKPFTCDNQNERSWLFDNFPNTPIIIYKKPIDIPLEGYEASAYLKFFYEYYDNLPQNMLCLHGHEMDWHHPKNNIFLELVKNIDIKYPYFNITSIYNDDRVIGSNPIMNMLNDVWDEYFRPYFNTDCPKRLSHFCCGQFIVKREAVLLRPRQAYEDWYKLSISYKPNKTIARVFEYMWHAIFGEPYIVSHTDLLNKFLFSYKDLKKILKGGS